MQPQGEQQTAQLGYQSERNPPRPPQVMTCAHRTQRPQQNLAQPSWPPSAQQLVVGAYRMRRAQGSQVVSVRTRATAGNLQMVDDCAWLVENLAMSGDIAMGKLGFETIGRANEVLVEAAKRKRDVTPDGKVASHELADPSCRITVKAERVARPQPDNLFAGLQYHSSHQVGLLLRVAMKLDQSRLWNDVIVEEQQYFERGLL